MNNYNYEYMDYLHSTPLDGELATSSITSDERINYMPNMDSYQIQLLNGSNMLNNSMNNMTNMKSNNSTVEPYQGFIRGNMFANEYEQYKNYRPRDINSSNERENLLNQLQQYAFALIDLDLYLDVNPNDSSAIKLYNNYLSIKNQVMDKYENMYGPLTLDSDDLNKNNWVWIRSPWPWEER